MLPPAIEEDSSVIDTDAEGETEHELDQEDVSAGYLDGDDEELPTLLDLIQGDRREA